MRYNGYSMPKLKIRNISEKVVSLDAWRKLLLHLRKAKVEQAEVIKVIERLMGVMGDWLYLLFYATISELYE